MITTRPLWSEELFDLLDEGVKTGRDAARLLIRFLHEPERRREALDLARQRAEQIARDTRSRLVQTPETGMEREDIEAVSYALFQATKSLLVAAEFVALAGRRTTHPQFTLAAEVVEQSLEIIAALVKELRHVAHLDEAKRLNDQLQALLDEAEDLIARLAPSRDADSKRPLETIMVQDLAGKFEQILERCRAAASLLDNIFLKNV